MIQGRFARMAATLVFGWILITSGAALAQDISGEYAMSGATADGGAYSGTTTITRTGETFAVEQNDSGSILTGTGIQLDDTLAAVFLSGGETFLAVYTLQPDGSLVGQWTTMASHSVGTETLTPLSGGGGGK